MMQGDLKESLLALDVGIAAAEAERAAAHGTAPPGVENQPGFSSEAGHGAGSFEAGFIGILGPFLVSYRLPFVV